MSSHDSIDLPRRLAAILSADGKNYSRLMGEDELGTVRTLTAHRTIMRTAIASFRGRVVDTPGDNVLAEFGSVVDAVECARHIQEAISSRNAELPEERRLEFRIGVNLGEVLIEDDRIYGDAVNVAARLESMADGGGICVSGIVHDQVSTKLAVTWEPLGEQFVKNIIRPVRVYRLVQPGATRRSASPMPRVPLHRPSIAVLPFWESDVPEAQRYFGDGVVEDVVGALASLPDLFVVSRSSTIRFRGMPSDTRSMGRDLGVRYLLSGSIRRSGRRLRITTELADTETQTVLWTDRIDGHVDELFELQDRVAHQTITTIAPYVREAEIRRALAKRPENLDAYDFTLRGLDLLYRLHRNQFETAREMFAQAISHDPGYASPYALTALWHSIRLGQGWSADPAVDRSELLKFAEGALERDTFDARALALCGHVRALQFHDYEGALALFDRAIAASPNSAVAWVRSSPTYSYLGDSIEAKRRAEVGLRLSPLDPHLFFTHAVLCLAYYTAGDFEAAAVWGRKALTQNPNFTANLRILTAALAAGGRLDEARSVARRLLDAEPGFGVKAFCDTYAFRDPGRRDAMAAHMLAGGLPE